MRSSSRFLVAVLALVAVTGCKPLDDTMVAIFGRSMRDSRSFDPYENPLQAPENSVPFSSGNAATELGAFNVGQPGSLTGPRLTQENMVPIGTGDSILQSLENPFEPGDSAALARGQEIYDRVCAVCHGPTGVGAQAYIAAQHPTLAAYNLSGAQVQGYTDQYIYGMMTVGRGLMPPWAHQIRPIDRWAVVTYVRELQADTSGGEE